MAAMITVDGVEMPCPSSYSWSLQDVSVGDSGRNESGKMYKGRVCQKRKISLEWWAKRPEEVAQILQAFNPEYITVKYVDAMQNAYITGEFYVGDRSAPVKQWIVGNKLYEKVSFDIIER